MYITRNSFPKFATGQASQASSLFVQAGNGNFAFVRLQKQPVKRYLPQGFFLIPGTERKVQTVANQILGQLYFPTEAMNNPRHTRLQLALQLYQFGLCLHCMNDQRFAYCFGHTNLITEISVWQSSATRDKWSIPASPTAKHAGEMPSPQNCNGKNQPSTHIRLHTKDERLPNTTHPAMVQTYGADN